MGPYLLLRAGAAGLGPQGLERQEGEHQGGPGGVRQEGLGTLIMGLYVGLLGSFGVFWGLLGSYGVRGLGGAVTSSHHQGALWVGFNGGPIGLGGPMGSYGVLRGLMGRYGGLIGFYEPWYGDLGVYGVLMGRYGGLLGVFWGLLGSGVLGVLLQ